MSKEKKDAKWNELAQKHEFLFGKAPRKGMKVETLEKKVNDEISKRSTEDGQEPLNPQEIALNEKISEALSSLVGYAKEAGAADGKPVMFTLLATPKGLHMSMAGEGQDVAIMIATAMENNPLINAVVSHAAIMMQMKGIGSKEEAIVKPKTEA